MSDHTHATHRLRHRPLAYLFHLWQAFFEGIRRLLMGMKQSVRAIAIQPLSRWFVDWLHPTNSSGNNMSRG